MQYLAELKLEAIMQHLRLCPSDKSPNKDYILGVMAGIDMYHVTSLDDAAHQLLQDEAVQVMQAWEPDECDTLEESDFVRNT